jgi:hypothetical protein
MTIELTTRAAAHALSTYLEGCGCTVQFVGERLLEVSPPERSQSPREAAIELDAYLRVWRALHPMHDAWRVDPADRRHQA